MRTTAACWVAGFLLLNGASALAECEPPRPGFEIPDGASSAEPALVAAQSALVTFADDVREYLRCLNGDYSQRAIGKDETRRAELSREHLDAHHAAASELRGLASCYAAQVEKFQSGGGGNEERVADCATFITAARNETPQRPQAARELVVEASGRSHDVSSGRWIFYLVRDDDPTRCAAGAPAECLYRAVHVRNESDEQLECNAEISYEGTDSEGKAAVKASALVTERATHVVLESLARQGVNASTFDAQCKARPPLAPLDTPADCKYQVVQPVTISDYYPPDAREAGHVGPVVVEFTLPGKAARPTEVRAVQSSLYESLDQAAVKAVGDMIMSSSCGKARYRLKLNFQLER